MDPGFPRGLHPKGWRTYLLFDQNFPETASKEEYWNGEGDRPKLCLCRSANNVDLHYLRRFFIHFEISHVEMYVNTNTKDMDQRIKKREICGPDHTFFPDGLHSRVFLFVVNLNNLLDLHLRRALLTCLRTTVAVSINSYFSRPQCKF